MPPAPLEPPLHSLAELRDLVDRRDARDSWAALFGWLHAGLATTASARELVAWASTSTRTIADVATWAREHDRLYDPRGVDAGEHPPDDRAASGTRDDRRDRDARAASNTRDDRRDRDARAGVGDLLVFDRTDSDTASDLIAIAIAQDPRGVVEFIYVSGGAIRRGFVDPRRPSIRRDESGAVANTFMRTGKRWPPKGTHYLAGELLAHVVRLR